MSMKKNLQSLFIIIVILTSFSTVQMPRSSVSEEIMEVQNMADLLNYIPSIEVEFKDHDDTIGTWGYDVIGEEDIDGTPTWKVESTFGEEGEKESYVTWISKIDGTVMQVEVEENILTGLMASMIGNATLSFWYAMVYSYWTAWDYVALRDVPEYGELTDLGTSEENYGPTVLTVSKYRFEGLTTAPDLYRYTVEIWLAPTRFGGITTYLYLQSNTNVDEWFSIELKHIELVEPEVVIQQPETEPEPEPEPESEPEESEPEKKTGGIPGFAYESIMIGLVVAVVFLWLIRKK
jgi:hypothetical protein